MSREDPWLVLALGEVEYGQAWDLQRRLVAARQQDAIADVLVLLQHPHTYTLGRRAVTEHLLWDAGAMADRRVVAYWVDRGGDITYHGPGQMVGYPVLALRRRGRDVHGYLRSIEEALIGALAGFGITAGRDPAYTGVWVDGRKIAAIGVKVSRGVTSHGFALNVNTDLSYFSGIVPCGISGRGVTSMQELLGAPQDLARVRQRVVESFVAEFGGPWEAAELEALLALAPPAPAGAGDRPAVVALQTAITR